MAVEEITIKVAKIAIKMNVDGTKLELYRLAEQRLNAAIMKFERLDNPELGADAPLALAAFEAMVRNITLAQSSHDDSDEIRRLVELDQRVEAHLSSVIEER